MLLFRFVHSWKFQREASGGKDGGWSCSWNILKTWSCKSKIQLCIVTKNRQKKKNNLTKGGRNQNIPAHCQCSGSRFCVCDCAFMSSFNFSLSHSIYVVCVHVIKVPRDSRLTIGNCAFYTYSLEGWMICSFYVEIVRARQVSVHHSYSLHTHTHKEWKGEGAQFHV